MPGHFSKDIKRMGRPAKEFTDSDIKTIQILAAAGTPYRVIGKAFGVSEATLSVRFRDELADAKAQCNGEVARTLYQMATSGACPAATFFWLKTQAGWRETQHIEHSGEIRSGLDLTKATDDELEVLKRLAARCAKSE